MLKVVITIEADSQNDFRKIGRAFDALGKSEVSYGLEGLADLIHHDYNKTMADLNERFASGGVVKEPNLSVVGDKPGPEKVPDEVLKAMTSEQATAPEVPAEVNTGKVKTTRKTKAEKQLEQANDLVDNGEAQLNPDGSMTLLSGIDVEPAVQKIAHDILKQRASQGDAAGFVNSTDNVVKDPVKPVEQSENAQEQQPEKLPAELIAAPDPNAVVVTADLLRRICYTLNTHGPAGKASLTVILKHVGATKFSEIPTDRYDEFYKLAMSDVNQFGLTLPDEL